MKQKSLVLVAAVASLLALGLAGDVDAGAEPAQAAEVTLVASVAPATCPVTAEVVLEPLASQPTAPLGILYANSLDEGSAGPSTPPDGPCADFPCKGGSKSEICHKNKNTLCISPSAVPAHLSQHDDQCGPCGAADDDDDGDGDDDDDDRGKGKKNKSDDDDDD